MGLMGWIFEQLHDQSTIYSCCRFNCLFGHPPSLQETSSASKIGTVHASWKSRMDRRQIRFLNWW